MDYYNKYLKYKTKYINLLKGGIVPQIDGDLLPFENTNINIIYQGRIILKNNDNPDNNYLLTDNYQFEKTQISINKPLFDASDLSILANLNVKLGSDDIPFHVGSLQFNFNIIMGIINYIDYYKDILHQKGIAIKKIKEFQKHIASKIFNVDIRNNLFLGITNQNSILNCFSFFNKLHEFLNYMLLNEYDKQTFDELFPNIENIKDFYNIYSFYYTEKNKECTIKKYKEVQDDTFYKHIKEFKDFIKNCNLIDKHIEFKSMFDISLINLILINWIYLRSLRTNLVIGSLSSNLYPISKLNFLENIFQMNEEKIYCYEKEQKELNNEEDINKLLLKKLGVQIVQYGQSTFNGHNFSNCVENAILQLLKILAWKDGIYDIDLLPEGISEEIKNIIKRINSEPLKMETKEIMNDFVVLVSNVINIKYRNGDHNIKSYIENVGNILNYIFNSKTVEGGIKDYNKEIFYKINNDTDEYSLEQENNIIIINKNNYKINVIINNGHAFIDNKINTIYRLINTYKYLKILYAFNYTKDDSINFSIDFVNFCKKQSPKIKSFLTDKLIKIQNISLKDFNSKDERGNSCLHIACIIGNLEKLQEYICYANINNIDNQSRTPLLVASEYDYSECIKFLIEKDADINVYSFGKTPLLYASIYGDLECLKLLIKKGVDINQKGVEGYTAFLLASENGHIECVELLIELGVDINQRNNYDNTALMSACNYGHFKCVKLLIKKGANINYVNKYGFTSFLLAIHSGNLDCVKFLICKNIDVNYANKFGDTPLLEASKLGNFECVKLLIENRANVNCANDLGITPLILASENGNLDCVKLLVENCAYINHLGNGKVTPLLMASSKGNIECIKFLINKGADLHHTDINGDTSLFRAAYEGHIECVKYLIKMGLDIDHKNKKNDTPLMRASERDNSKCIIFLIENGANINHINKKGDTPLSIASGYNNMEVIKLLIKKGADINIINKFGETPLFKAIYHVSNDAAELLIKKGADINLVDSNGNTPLSIATEFNNIEMTELLIEYGADINYVNKSGSTSLLKALYNGSNDAAKLLIKKGVDLNYFDKRGNTPLLIAINNGNIEIINLLKQHGADINYVDKLGETILFKAIYNHSIDTVKLLIKNGANIKHVNISGKTPLEIARDLGDTEIIYVLKEHGAKY